METLNYGEEREVKVIPLSQITSQLTKTQKEKVFSGYDVKNLAKIFEDSSMMATAESFLANGMNVAKTARATYMHRNTLLYRLNTIKRLTGLDLRDFQMAVTFEILHSLYAMK